MISIRRKNILVIGTIVAAFFALITLYVVLIFRDNQIQLADQKLKLLCRDASAAINSRNEQAILLVETMAEYQDNGGFGRREEIIQFTKKILENNDFITGAYVGYEPDADSRDEESIGLSPGYDQTGRFLPYWHRRSGKILLQPLVDMATSPYYMGPKNNRRLTITEPYLYEGTMLLEVTTPILVDGRFAGITGVDLAAAYLSMNLQNYKEFYQTAHVYLVSGKNNIIAADNHALIGQRVSADNQLSSVMGQIGSAKQPGVLPMDSQPDRIISYAPIPSSGWMLVLTVAKAEIFSQANNLTYNMTVILAAVLLVLLITLFFSEKVISRPLNEITKIIKRMANSDFDFDENREMASFKKRPDEVGEISRATCQMRTNISALIQELQKNETQYRTLVTNVPGVVYRSLNDQQHTIAFISDSIEGLTGYPAADFIGHARRSLASIIHPEDREINREAAKLEILAQKPFTAIFRLVCADGSIIWVQNRCQGIYDQNGRLLHVDGVILDMTKQVSTQAALRANEITLSSVFESIQDGFTLLDPELTIVRANQPMQEMYAFDSPLEGQKCYQVFYQRQTPCDNCTALRVMHQKMKISEDIFKRFNGVDHWFETTYYPIIDDDTGISRGVLCMVRDITPRKLAQEQLSYQSNLLEMVNDAIVAFDLQGQITYWNHGAEKIYGWAAYEALDKGISEVFATDVSFRERYRIIDQLKIGQPVHGEYVQHRREGEAFWVEVSCYPLYSHDGTIKGFVSLNRDIDSKKLLDRELARIDQLSLVGQMAASIAHEIRNPMTSVHGFLQILSEKSECQRFQEYFTLMISELNRANEIITQFLSLASNKPVVFQMSSLNKVISKILPLIQSDALMANQQLQAELGEVPDFRMDEKEISQLVLNLSRNGLEAMQDNGTLTIRTQYVEGCAELQVSDEGPGIPLSVMEKLGTPFLTTKDQGTGLGLAVCFSIAHRHKTRIDVFSSSQGTTFSVKFPVQPPEELQPSQPVI